MKKSENCYQNDLKTKFSNSILNIISRNLSEKKLEEERIKEKYDKFLKPLKYDYEKIIITPNLCLSDDLYFSDLKCILCNNIALEPKMCIQCDGLYCNLCIKSITNKFGENYDCFLCKNKLKLKGLNKKLNQLLNNLILSCPSNFDYEKNCLKEDKICRDIVIYRDMIEHLNVCMHMERYVKCTNCSYSGFYTQVFKHLIQMKCNEYLKMGASKDKETEISIFN